MKDTALTKEIIEITSQFFMATSNEMTDINRQIAALVARREAAAVLKAERNLLSSQISRHLFMDYAEQGAIDRINVIDAELAALTTEATQSGKEEQE